MSKHFVRVLLGVAVLASAVASQGDVFNMPIGQKSLEIVPVGNPGNPADILVSGDGTSGYGSVAYTYQIGKYLVTNSQYVAFLDSVAKTDTYGVYVPTMTSEACGGIIRNGSQGDFIYTVKPGYENMPVVNVNWYDTLRFCNWLSNGQPKGVQDETTTEGGVYALTGKFSVNALPDHSSLTGSKWFLPTENEWYKSAFHKNDGVTGNYWMYATSSNVLPVSSPPTSIPNRANYFDSVTGHAVTGSTIRDDNQNYLTEVGAYSGSASAYQTFDQSGDVGEWTEAPVNASRVTRGGCWNYDAGMGPGVVAAWGRASGVPTLEGGNTGFRVAATGSTSVPEPSTLALLGIGVFGLAGWAWRRRSYLVNFGPDGKELGSVAIGGSAVAHGLAGRNVPSKLD